MPETFRDNDIRKILKIKIFLILVKQILIQTTFNNIKKTAEFFSNFILQNSRLRVSNLRVKRSNFVP